MSQCPTRYVLRSKPEVWTDPIRTKVLAAFSLLLDLLGKLQVRRCGGT